MKKIAGILGGTLLLVLLGWGMTQLDAPPKPAAAPSAAAPAGEAPAPAGEAPAPAPPLDPRTAAVDACLQTMTAQERVGQLFFARFPAEGAAAQAKELALGGYLLFGRDFKDRTPDALRELLAACRSAAKVPLLLGVDEEGGTVTRASAYPQFRESKFRSPQRLYENGGLDAIANDAREKALFLKDLGININLAPVCDVSEDPEDYMYPRTFGRSAEETAEYVRLVVQATQDAGVGCVLKHFPGYGGNADTHTGAVVDARPRETFLARDFLPFAAGAEAGAGCVLVSHNVVTCFDETRPASLSPAVHATLRAALSFSGVCMTDDLAMDAITDVMEVGDAAVQAIKAGNDLLISSDVRVQHAAVLAALGDGTLEPSRVDEAVRRVLGWKYDLGLLAP